MPLARFAEALVLEYDWHRVSVSSRQRPWGRAAISRDDLGANSRLHPLLGLVELASGYP